MKADRCTRSLAEQVQDRTGSRRRADHVAPVRLDLASDDDLDAYVSRWGSAALDAHELLTEEMAKHVEAAEEIARHSLESRTADRPLLSVFVCMTCGVFDVARCSRSWTLDRAMRRTGYAERDVLAIVQLLTEAYDGRPPSLDGLSAERLAELRELVGEDVDHQAIRDRYGEGDTASRSAHR